MDSIWDVAVSELTGLLANLHRQNKKVRLSISKFSFIILVLYFYLCLPHLSLSPFSTLTTLSLSNASPFLTDIQINNNTKFLIRIFDHNFALYIHNNCHISINHIYIYQGKGEKKRNSN